MKENEIKLGGTYYLKSWVWHRDRERINDNFLVTWILKRGKKPTRFYDSNREYAYANQLSMVSCSGKKCPCHNHKKERNVDGKSR
jgi:hypothetical protein